MRATLTFLGLLVAAAPALAADPGSEAEAVTDRADREPRMEPAGRAERSERATRANGLSERWQRSERREERVERADRVEGVGRAEQVVPSRPVARQSPTPDSVAGWRSGERSRDRDARLARDDVGLPGEAIPTTPGWNEQRNRNRQPAYRDGQGFHDRLSDRRLAETWRREWRGDRRYDWRRHRDRNRDRFRIGIYVDPFGWSYRPWQVGRSLPPHYRAGRYWIDDPWDYRLPHVSWPYRWVRYWNDALLVDVRTGRVIDVVPQFFW